jgi:para-nitrobenzyl esterase
VYNWTPDDYKVSAVMQGYFANFIKTGDPNGVGLPTWPADNSSDDIQTMHIDVNTHAEPDQTEARYRFLDQLFVEDQAKGH